MASYDSTTGVHTMTINEAASYLRGLPENTKETPYKVDITGIDLSNEINKNNFESFMRNIGRYLDLKYTEIFIVDKYTLQYLFAGSKFLIHSPVFNNKNNLAYTMYSTFDGCENLITITNIPNGVTDMSFTFANCANLITAPYIPYGVTDMRYIFSGCRNLITITNIPKTVTDIEFGFATCFKLETVRFDCDIDFSSLNTRCCFKMCYKLKEFIYNVEYKENDDWTLYLLKRIGNNLNIKRYSIETNTLIDEHIISLSNVTTELDLLSKSDELLIDRAGNITDQQIDLLLKSRMEFGDKYSLDPQKKWLVVWADNPDNVRSNCFVTQQELKELKALLKTKHPDLF